MKFGDLHLLLNGSKWVSKAKQCINQIHLKLHSYKLRGVLRNRCSPKKPFYNVNTLEGVLNYEHWRPLECSFTKSEILNLYISRFPTLTTKHLFLEHLFVAVSDDIIFYKIV